MANYSKKLVAALKQTVDGVEDNLKCYRCDTIRDTYVICSNCTDTICFRCSQKKTRCQSCGKKDTFVHNKILNVMVKNFAKKCANTDEGCSVLGHLEKIINHEIECHYRGIRCPNPVNSACGVIKMTDFKNHLTGPNHAVVVHKRHSYLEFVLAIPGNKTYEKTEIWRERILVVNGLNFLIFLKSSHGRISFEICVIGTEESASRYSATISLNGRKKHLAGRKFNVVPIKAACEVCESRAIHHGTQSVSHETLKLLSRSENKDEINVHVKYAINKI